MTTDFTEKQKIEFEKSYRDAYQKIVRAFVAFFAFFFISLIPLLKINNDFVRWAILLLWLGGGISLWWLFRQYWKCPACSKRWDSQQIFASRHWDYCPDCGAPLTRSPREARIPLNLDSHDNLKRQFRHRRRLSNIALSVLIPVSIVILVLAQSRGIGREANRILGAVLGSITLGVALGLSRCLNCKKGIVMGSSWRCPRCGVSFR